MSTHRQQTSLCRRRYYHFIVIIVVMIMITITATIKRHNHHRCSQRSHSPNCGQANLAPSRPVLSAGDSFTAFPKYLKDREYGTVCTQQKLLGRLLFRAPRNFDLDLANPRLSLFNVGV